jgi:hypothetical protein
MKEASALAEYAEESLSPLTPALDNREALLRSPENYCCRNALETALTAKRCCQN